MRNALAIAIICSLAAIIAAFFVGGRYVAVGVGSPDGSMLYVVDRFTGAIRFCLGTQCAPSKPQSN
jgi:hypothetical protein